METLFILISGYLLLVLAASLIAPRMHAYFATERGIFRLHFISVAFLAVGLFSYLYVHPSEELFAGVIAALSAHAILSISFLEIWSLAEGGYSIQMILTLRKKPIGRDPLIDMFANLGDGKRENRLKSLMQIGLIQDKEQTLELTPRGRIVARILRALHALVNIEGNA